MKYFISEIEYDLEDAFGEVEEDEIDLPDTLVVECDDEDEVADAISDETGFCVLSFVIDRVKE